MNPSTLRMTPLAHDVIELAKDEAARIGHRYRGVEHVMIAMARADGGYLDRLLRQLDWHPALFRAHLRAFAHPDAAKTQPAEAQEMTPRLKAALEQAQILAQEQSIGEQALLLAILNAGPSVVVRVFQTKDVPITTIQQIVKDDTGPEAQRLRKRGEDAIVIIPQESPIAAAPQRSNAVERYCADAIAEAQTAPHQIIGRKSEITALAGTLLQSMRNSPLLVGPAGIGKTSIVQGFVQRLAEHESRPVQEELHQLHVFRLNMASFTTGAVQRTDGAERLAELLQACANNPQMVLIIDELSDLFSESRHGAGGQIGSILKTALANAKVRIIGVMTPERYHSDIAADPSLDRLFQVIRVEGMTPEVCKEVMRKTQKRLMSHHHVAIQPEAIDAAVDLSERYLPNQPLPAKALELLDAACVGRPNHSLDSFRMTAREVDADESDPTITARQVAKTLSKRLGIPLSRMEEDESASFLRLRNNLRLRLLGQEAAIDALVNTLLVTRSALSSARRTRGVFFFSGPTGSGKTEAARVLTDSLFFEQAQQRMKKLDMAQFNERHTVSRLIGSPPGYVDSDKEGELTGWLDRYPYSIIVLDEMEKAHPEVWKIFLSLFEEGRIADAHGKQVDGRHAIYIMTSNLLPIAEAGFLPQPPPEESIAGQLSALVGPEFVGRLDRIVVFRTLVQQDLSQVAQLRIDDLERNLIAEGYSDLIVETSALNWLVEQGMAMGGGARGILHSIEQRLIQPLASMLARNALQPPKIIIITYDDGNNNLTIRQ